MTSLRQHTPLAFVLLLAAVCFSWILELGFTDTDALADVAAARVDGFGGIWGELTVPLTDGVAGKNANFWRPTTMLQFAMLRGLFGWSPVGWQAWDLGLHLLCMVLVYAIVRPRSESGALLAAVIFGFHPLSLEVVPAVARSIDSLMCALFLLSLWSAGRGRWAWALFWGALSLGAKETALAALPMAVFWAWVCGHRQQAKALATGLVVLTLGYLAVRHQVLQGIGGYYETETLQIKRVRAAMRAAPWEMIAPGWSGFLGQMPTGLRLPSGILLLSGLVVFGARGWRAGDTLRVLGVGLVLLPLALYAVTGTYTRRLLYLPTAGLALTAIALLSSRSGRILLGIWLLSLVPASPLLQQDQGWRANDEVTSSMTWRLEEAFAELPPGSLVWLVDRPVRIDGFPERRRLWTRGKTLNNAVAGYSLQAWADDRLRPGQIRFRTLSFSEPWGELGSARVAVRNGTVVVERSNRLRRTKLLKKSLWSREIDANTMTLEPAAELSGDYLLVAGTPESVLVRLP